MEKQNRRRELFGYGIGILVAELVGALAALASGAGGTFYDTLEKPPFAPPGWLFPVMWVLLYALMGAASYRVWRAEKGENRTAALVAYTVQLAVNFLWPVIFFRLENLGAALGILILLCVLIAVTTFLFRKVDRTSARLMLPYLAWSLFAAYLNTGIFFLNA